MQELITNFILQNWEIIGLIALAVIANVLYKQVPSLKNAVKSRMSALRTQNFEASIALSQTVKVAIEDLRVAAEADRVFICQFHNGRNFVNETMHQYYYSTTWQTQTFGMTEIEIERRSVSSDIGAIIEIMTNDQLILNNIASVKNSHFKFLNLTYGISSCLCLKLVNGDNEIWGFIVLAYNHPQKITKTIVDKGINFVYSFKSILRDKN